jgi:hypothetical protein
VTGLLLRDEKGCVEEQSSTILNSGLCMAGSDEKISAERFGHCFLAPIDLQHLTSFLLPQLFMIT